MKWSQHQTNARNDWRVKALIQKHGPAGYGVYFLVNEILAEKIEENPNCVLEFTTEILAIEVNIHSEVLQTILDSCLTLGLFTKLGDKIQNLKVPKYCDNWAKRNKIPMRYGVTTEPLQRDYSDTPSRIDKNRLEQNKTKQIKKDLDEKPVEDTKQFFQQKAKDLKSKDEKAFDNFKIPSFTPTDSESIEQKRQRMLKQAKDLEALG